MKHMQSNQSSIRHNIYNFQETSNIFGTKHNRNNSIVLAKRQYYSLNERIKLIPAKSKFVTAALCLSDIFTKLLEIYQILA